MNSKRRPRQTRFIEAALFYKLSKDSSTMNALKKELRALSRQTKKSLPLMARPRSVKPHFLGAYALTAGICSRRDALWNSCDAMMAFSKWLRAQELWASLPHMEPIVFFEPRA